MNGPWGRLFQGSVPASAPSRRKPRVAKAYGKLTCCPASATLSFRQRSRAMVRYSKVMVVLHWTTAILILAAWFTAEGGSHVRQNPPMLHFSLGLTVLLLVVPRLVARLLEGRGRRGPARPLAQPRGQDRAYGALHLSDRPAADGLVRSVAPRRSGVILRPSPAGPDGSRSGTPGNHRRNSRERRHDHPDPVTPGCTA